MQLKLDKTITREEIQKALKDYIAAGGSIKVLPPQQTPHHSYIGGFNWGPYEELENLMYSD